jgi:hypothetical protein
MPRRVGPKRSKRSVWATQEGDESRWQKNPEVGLFLTIRIFHGSIPHLGDLNPIQVVLYLIGYEGDMGRISPKEQQIPSETRIDFVLEKAVFPCG